MSPSTEKQKKQPRLIIVAAPSAAGKTTLCEMLLRDFPKVQLSISTTTRPIRPKEQDGVHYFFVTPEVFKQKIKNGEFAEFATVHDNLYGTSKKTVESLLSQGRHILFDIDVQGAMNLKSQYPEQALLIFVHPPSMEELEKRLRARKGDSPEAIEKRLRNAYSELAWSQKFDYQIVNDDLDRAYQELKAVIQRECQ